MRKIIALFSAAAVLASSAAASAHERYRHGYDRDHGYPAYGYGHHYRAYPQLRYPGYQPYYGQGYNYPPYGYAPGYYYQPAPTAIMHRTTTTVPATMPLLEPSSVGLRVQ